MFVILTDKPGQFHTETGGEVRRREAWDYLLDGRMRARFTIAELAAPTRVRIVDEVEAGAVNDVPTKFLPTFQAVEAARAELEQLIRYGTLDAKLVRHEVASPEVEARLVHITLLNQDGRVISTQPNSNLLRASLRQQGGIPFKCGGGVCGTCKCRIERGLQHTDAVKPKERKHLTQDMLDAGYRMACQTFVLGDIAVSW